MKKCILLATTVLVGGFAQATIVDFDSKSPVPGGYYKPNTGGLVDWQDNGVTFGMTEDLTYGYSWAGYTYSDVNDPATGGSSNQYAVYGDGLDYSDAGVYAVGYVDGFNGINPTISFGSAQTINGFYANNTAYAAHDMLNGSGFSKKFGGATGDDADWFMLTIEGFDASSSSQGAVDFYLADYRFADNGQDYIIDDWTFVDLSSLGADVSSLTFSLSSSDTGAWGMNTPAYFAIDNVEAIPEPGTITLMLTGFGGMAWFRRLKR